MGRALIAGLVLLVGSGGVTVGLPTFLAPPAMTAPASGTGLADIPPAYHALIVRWAASYGIDWAVLAGVLKVECDFGRNCRTSPTGAEGPAQFEPATWAAYGVDGDGDAHRDPWTPADAVASAANYLHALGAAATAGVRAALCHYNAGNSPAFQACMEGTQQPDYADAVLTWAARYRTSAAGTGQPGNPFGGACQPVVTQPYGPTALAGEPVIDGRPFHTGIDLACPLGTPIHSLTSGVARVVTGWSPDPCCFNVGGGFGDNVVVETEMSLGGEPAQRYFIRYAHMLGEIAVMDGQAVAPGDLLGFEGSSGFSTGPHLHFEIDRGAPGVEASIDPSALLALP